MCTLNYKIKIIILIIIGFCISSNSFSKNYYVDPSSTLAIANGTITNPWKTIAQLNSGTTNLLPGDSVFLKKGQIFTGKIIVGGSGNINNPIVYTTYGTGNMPELTNTTSDLIYIFNKEYVVIDGLKLIDKTMNTTDHSIVAKISYGIVLENAPHCTIRNNEITLVGVGIAAREGSDFTNIDNNFIHNLRSVRNTIGGNDDYGANAMVIGTSLNTITNNRFEECWATSYDYGYDGGAIEFYGSTISYNKMLYNTAINCNGFIEIGSGTYGISTENLIGYNKIINCGQIGTFHNKIDGFAIRTDNLQFYNNVIIETKKQFSPVSAMFWYADPTKVDVVILKNNIIWLTNGINVVNNNVDTLKMVHTNNIYKLRGGILGIKLNATEKLLGNEGIFVDTLGDPANWDYKLINGSIAVNFGTNVGLTRDYIGNPIIDQPDAGILEKVNTRFTKFYIDPSSTVNNVDGSITNPWKTIEQLNNGTTNLLPGDSVFFKKGQVFTGGILIRSSGNINQPIVYTSYGTGTMPELTHSLSDVIYILNRQYVVIDGLKIIDKTMNNSDHSIISKIAYGIVLENSPNCSIKNTEITLVGIGIAIREGSNNTTINNNNIYNLRSIRNTIGGSDDYGANAIVIGSSFNKIKNNRFEGCWATSYDYGYLGGTIELYNTSINENQIIYNIALNCNGFIEIGGQSNGTAINNLIAYNKIINCGQTATIHNKVDGSFVNTNNTRFYNNIIIENKIQFTPAREMFWYADPTLNDLIILKNNIIWLTTGENVVSNNLDTLKLVHTNNIYKLRNSSLGINLDPSELFIGDVPVFVDTSNDPESWDYRLLPGSPGVNFGVDLGFTNDFIGNPIIGKPDVGIYELIPPPPPLIPRKYYVDPSASSTTSNGSFLNPWKTIAQLNAGTSSLVPGDSIFLKRGQVFNGRIVIGGSGLIDQPIVYTSYGTGSLPELTNSTTTSELIYALNRRYVIIDGFRLTDKTMDSTNHSITAKIAYGIVLDNSPNCSIRNSEITLVGIGIANRNGSDFTEIINNKIFNLRAIRNTVGGADDYGANAIVIGSSSNVIEYNKFENCWSTSFDYGYLGGAIELYNFSVNNNQIQYNTAVNCSGFLEIGGESNGTAINNLIGYNKIINCGQTGIFHNKIDGNYINTNNTRFFNNVIIETKEQFTPTPALFWYADPTKIEVVIMINNIVWLTTGQSVVLDNLDTSKLVHSNNIFKIRNGILGINLNKSELLANNSQIFADTIGDPIGWDYQVPVNSPAINFGTNVGILKDFIGNPIIGKPDAGILENQTVNTIPKLEATALAGIINCYGEATSISVSASGGIAPYTGTGVFVETAGTYNYIVTDAIGTKDTASITLAAPTQLSLNIFAEKVNSIIDTTTIFANANGGSIPYSYQLNNNIFQSAHFFNNITLGTYNITVKDKNNCTKTESIEIIQSIFPLIAVYEVSPIKCFGATTTLTITATGGVAPYTGTGSFIVTTGSYRYIVSDAIGTKDTIDLTLTAPSKLTLSLSTSIITSYLSTNILYATASGGTSPYLYQLNGGLFQATGTFYNIAPGTYTVTVKDANDCLTSANIQVIVTDITENVDKRLLINVFPNPTASFFTVNTIRFRGKPVTMDIKVYNLNGNLLYAATGMSDRLYTFGSNFPAGTYTLIAKVDGTVQYVKLIKL